MSDEEYFEQLCSNSIDGTLTDSEREKLEAHLAECPSCAALKRDLEQMQAMLSEEVEPPAGLHESIMQRLEQENKLQVVQPEKPVRRMPVVTMLAAAAAVVLVVLGGGLMPMFFSTVGGGATAASSDAAAVTAEGSVPSAAARDSSDMSGAVKQAAEDAGLSGRAAGDAGAVPESNGAGTETAPETYTAAGAAEQAQPAETAGTGAAETQPERIDASTLTPADKSGAQTDAAAAPETSAAQHTTQSVEMPESMRAMTVAHCYLAQGGGELPDIGGELLGTDGETSWFLLDNSLSTIQDTLGAVEAAGYTVSAYEGTGIAIDSKATSWMLIVAAD